MLIRTRFLSPKARRLSIVIVSVFAPMLWPLANAEAALVPSGGEMVGPVLVGEFPHGDVAFIEDDPSQDDAPEAQANEPASPDGASQTDKAEPESEPEPEAEEPSPVPSVGEWWLETQGWGADQGLVDEGYLVEWDPHFWAAHWYTDAGQAIQAMQAGDIVHIDGTDVVICGSFDVPYDGMYVDDVRAEWPTEWLFQTCYGPGEPYMMIKYGYPV